jgi:hypothetical protein
MDKSIEKFSYSRLDTLNQCPMKFKLKYEDGKYSTTSSLALELGSIAHKGKELVAEALIAGKKPDYEYIKGIIENGYVNVEDGCNSNIPGTKELKDKYFFDWIKPDDKSGLTYEQKLEIYFNGLSNTENEISWIPIAVEMPFEFTYKDKYLIGGFIDLVEKNQDGDLRVVDYKSSRKVYDSKYLATPLQMFIYGLAVQNNMEKIPIEYIYDFVFLGEKQEGCSRGYQKRGETKLDKLFAKLEECRGSELWEPKQSPLCHYCDFCETNNNADPKYNGECQFFSLWTQANKTFDVNKKFDPEAKKQVAEFWF